jgi:outer membrane protein OmpA-like peptidoglycan-associated protein
MKNKFLVVFASFAMVLPAFAQSNSSTPPQDSTSGAALSQDQTSTAPQTPDDQTVNPTDQDHIPQFNYRVNVIQRSTVAVDYRDRAGTTKVDFKGTSLMPHVDGHADVTGHTGRMAIDASFHHLKPAREFGPEYLTYVLWAITPEGRAVNLGEVMPDDGNAHLQLTTGLQEFGLILTAEPYFAVTRPSDMLVAENIVRSDTKGATHPITARYELLQKGQYTVNISPAQLPGSEAEHAKKTATDVLEAENAVAIAQASGADRYAPDTLQKAKDYLDQALNEQRHDKSKTAIRTVARTAVETAEDARLITLEKKQQERAAIERRREEERIQRAQSHAEQEAIRAEEARTDAQREADQRALADQERMAAEQARAQAEQARLEAQQEAQQAAQEKAQAEQQLQQAQAARQQAEQQQQTLAQQAEQARLQAQQAEQAKLQTEQQAEQQRQRLLQQLNQVLQTKDTAKGLIVNVSDVLFDTGKATLKPGAKVRLAKVAGIILAYPDLRLEVDGYTDSTGTHEINEELSQRRADAVRDFLVSQGVSSNNVGARGFAESDPIASNSTPTGRQLNRRVELVVSGTAIGQNVAPAGATPAAAGGISGAAGAASTTTTMPNSTSSPASVASPTTTSQPSQPASVSQPSAPGATTSPDNAGQSQGTNVNTPAGSPPMTPAGSSTGTGTPPSSTTPPPNSSTPLPRDGGEQPPQ